MITEKTITKKGYNFNISITKEGRIRTTINDGKAFFCEKLHKKNLYFYCEKQLIIDGKEMNISGLSLTDDIFYHLKKAQDKVLKEIKEKKEAEERKERAAILSGEKPLDIHYQEGEYLSAYTAHGISADILLENNCAKYISGWGIRIHSDFEDGNINKVLANGRQHREKLESEKKLAEEIAQKAAREKEELISQVDSWDIEESIEEDEGGRTKIYIHTFLKNGKKYVFLERNVFDFGVVINPNYKVLPELKSTGALMTWVDTKRFWRIFEKNEWETARELYPDEAICYEIVSRYGNYAGSSIRM